MLLPRTWVPSSVGSCTASTRSLAAAATSSLWVLHCETNSSALGAGGGGRAGEGSNCDIYAHARIHARTHTHTNFHTHTHTHHCCCCSVDDFSTNSLALHTHTHTQPIHLSSYVQHKPNELKLLVNSLLCSPLVLHWQLMVS